MLEDYAQGVIDQVTLRKLSYAQDMLEMARQPHSGSRMDVRRHLSKALEKKAISLRDIVALLDELDIWGDQRIRIVRLPKGVLAEYSTWDRVKEKISAAGMAELVDGPMQLVPPPELTPMRIEYEDGNGRRSLRLLAAKTRTYMVAQKDVPERHDEELYPGVVFKPFKEERQKAVGLAEVDLKSGLCIVSVAMFRRGMAYEAEFDEFYSVFESPIPLNKAEPVSLYSANHRIKQLPLGQLRLVSSRTRTADGGEVAATANSSKSDVRADRELQLIDGLNPDAPHRQCNCYWECQEGLDEVVHTHIVADDGEISIFGQISEKSGRYVLQRILDLI